MNKRQVLSSLNLIANELDNNGLYAEATQISNVMEKIAQNKSDFPKNDDELMRRTYDMHREFMQKVPKETLYKFRSMTRSDVPGYLFIDNPKYPDAGQSKMSLKEVRKFIDNGFRSVY